MRSLLPLVAGAAALLLTACGGETKTVTETASAPAPTAPPDSGSTGASGTTGTSGASATTGATESAPGAAPLPTDTGGATAVQGTYAMTVTTTDIGGPNKGKELSWSAVTRCTDTCTISLERENDDGGFKRLELAADGTTRYAKDSTGTTDYCVTDGIRPTKDRTSISVQKQRDEGGVPLATEIEGFVRITFKCKPTDQQTKIVYRVRGRLQG